MSEGPREEVRTRQDLEPVADADQGSSVGDEVAETVAESDGEVERQHPTGTERVGVAEATRHDGESGVVEQPGSFDQFVGECDLRVGAGELERLAHVEVAVGARSGDDDRLDRLHASFPSRGSSPEKASASAETAIGSRPGSESDPESSTVPRRTI